MTKDSSTKKYIATFAGGTIIGIAVATSLCYVGFQSWKKSLKPKETTTVETIYDTVERHFTTAAPAPKTEIVIEHDTLFIDTTKVIDDYFTERDYCIDFDSDSASATLHATVARNLLLSSDLDIRCLSATTTITNTIETFVPQMPIWGVGIGTGVSLFIPSRKVGINLALSLDYKRNTFLIHYDPINRYTGIGYRYQVWHSKK